MARPTKPSNLLSECSQTKDEIAQRERAEKKLRGDGGLPKPPKYLTTAQKKIFKRTVDMLKDSGILCDKDTGILESYAISYDRVQNIETLINENPDELTNSKLMAAKKQYQSDYYRCCNELGMSPQSRAKFANLTAEKEVDPLAEIVKLVGEDEQS
jgi:P27 family predicted phage terminase small subunit